MCEPSGVKQVLRDIPFKIAALANMLEKGSNERSLANSVKDSVKADIEYCLKRLEQGLKD